MIDSPERATSSASNPERCSTPPDHHRKHAQRKLKRFEASRTSRIEERPTLRSGRAWRHSWEAPMPSE
jgi:hypothetical protein